MRKLNAEYSISEQIKLIRKYLKLKILEDNVTFRNHSHERNHVYDLIKRTILHGESHSALMIGPRGSGKTTLINSVLSQLSKEVDLSSDAIVVKLNGIIHGDDKIALKSITAQMQLENAVGDRVFGTFAENLAFLLSCLQSGTDRRCRSMLFVLEEFDMFCHSGRIQTLLYNLFDITHSKQAPMCVLGITNRIDVMELLEKRVKSRFSHRHIVIFPNEVNAATGEITKSSVANYIDIMMQLLSMPVIKDQKKKKSKKSTGHTEEMDVDQDQTVIPGDIINKCKVDPNQFSALDAAFVQDWNAHVSSLTQNEKVVDGIEKLCYYTNNEQIFRNILFQLVSKMNSSKPYIEATDLVRTIDNTVAPEHRVKQLQSLSILELSLVIAMMHGVQIFDGQPMNFEMVLHRYTKFANINSSAQTVPRPVILKAFEHLHSLELILPTRTDSAETTGRMQKEYRLYTLAVHIDDIKEAVKGFKALPTEIGHWFNNSVF